MAKAAEQVKIESLAQGAAIPRAGQPWPGINGAIYAGLVPGFLNDPDYHLVILADRPAAEELKWSAAVEWARGLGADLPTRNESAFLYALHRDLFETSWYYWTSTQYSSGHAWAQYFDVGNQDYLYEGCECRARAVRRFNSSILQSFEAPAAQLAEAA